MHIIRNFIDKHVEITDEEWGLLLPSITSRSYKKGDVISFKEAVWTDYIFIKSGIVRSYITDNEGREFTRQLYFNTEESRIGNLFIVDLPSLLTQAPSYRKYEVLADTEAFVFSRKAVYKLYDQSKKWERIGRIVIELAHLDFEAHDYSLLTQNTKQRYMYLTQAMSGLVDKIPQYHIASFLGVTPESLSRIKKEMKYK